MGLDLNNVVSMMLANYISTITVTRIIDRKLSMYSNNGQANPTQQFGQPQQVNQSQMNQQGSSNQFGQPQMGQQQQFNQPQMNQQGSSNQFGQPQMGQQQPNQFGQPQMGQQQPNPFNPMQGQVGQSQMGQQQPNQFGQPQMGQQPNQFNPMQGQVGQSQFGQSQMGQQQPNQFNPMQGQPQMVGQFNPMYGQQQPPTVTTTINKTPRYVSLVSSLNKTALKEIVELVCAVVSEKNPGLNIDVNAIREEVGITLRIQPGAAPMVGGPTCMRVPGSGKNKGIRCTNPIDMVVGGGKICAKCANTKQGKDIIAAGQPFGYQYNPVGQVQTNFVHPAESLFRSPMTNINHNPLANNDMVKPEDAILAIPEYNIYVLKRTPGIITSQSNGTHQLIGKLSADRRSVEKLTDQEVNQLYRLTIMGDNGRVVVNQRVGEVHADPQRQQTFMSAVDQAWSDSINVKDNNQQNQSNSGQSNPPQQSNPFAQPQQVQQQPPPNPFAQPQQTPQNQFNSGQSQQQNTPPNPFAQPQQTPQSQQTPQNQFNPGQPQQVQQPQQIPQSQQNQQNQFNPGQPQFSQPQQPQQPPNPFPQPQQNQQTPQPDPLSIPQGDGPAIGEAPIPTPSPINNLNIDMSTIKIDDKEVDPIDDVKFENPAPEQEPATSTHPLPFVEDIQAADF